jgi:hypothetical protein
MIVVESGRLGLDPACVTESFGTGIGQLFIKRFSGPGRNYEQERAEQAESFFESCLCYLCCLLFETF